MPSEASVKFFDETFFQKSFDLALIGAQRRKETRETVAKGHAFPGRGRAIRAKDSPLPLMFIGWAAHMRRVAPQAVCDTRRAGALCLFKKAYPSGLRANPKSFRKPSNSRRESLVKIF